MAVQSMAVTLGSSLNYHHEWPTLFSCYFCLALFFVVVVVVIVFFFRLENQFDGSPPPCSN